MKEDIIVVQKGDEKWEIGRDKGTKIKGGDLKKGSRVTIHYKMIASSIDVKDAGDAKTGTKIQERRQESRKQDQVAHREAGRRRGPVVISTLCLFRLRWMAG